MAHKDKVIYNRVTGIAIRFLQISTDTNGQLLEVEATYPGQSTEPPMHFHPHQKETFHILEGELNVRMNGTVTRYQKDDLIFIPRNKIHSMWNASDSKTIVNWKVEPAMNTEDMMAIVAGLANDNYTNEKGIPGMLPTALLFSRFSKIFRLARPSIWVLRILLAPIIPIAYLKGYNRLFKKYVKVLA